MARDIQRTQPKGAHSEQTKPGGNPSQSKDSQDRMKNPADRDPQETGEQGGEESRHGRNQKGSVDDT
jgi:hypothetical protein